MKVFSLLSMLILLFQCRQSWAAPETKEQCLACHEDPTLKDPSGRSLFVSQKVFAKSIHGTSGLSCVSCHTDLENVNDFPHSEKLAKVNCSFCHEEAQKKFQQSVHAGVQAKNDRTLVTCGSCHGYHDILARRDVNSRIHPLQLPQTCGSCHFSKVESRKATGFVKGYLESVHALALSKAGLSTSATCATCHGAHEVKQPEDPSSPVSRRHVPETCGQCHSGILRDYHEGVHGQAFAEGVREVPVCTDCHGEHEIRSPLDRQSKVYPTQVALTCAKCHDDEEITQKYHLPTARLRSFQGTFHGIASAYGETRVANCASCHGFHNIRRSVDPKSPVNHVNLPQTCGQCHVGAGPRLSRVTIHVLDERTANYAGYLVKKLYFYFISAIIGGFVFYILADFNARRRLRRKGRHGNKR
jgi:hypothetical protein